MLGNPIGRFYLFGMVALLMPTLLLWPSRRAKDAPLPVWLVADGEDLERAAFTAGRMKEELLRQWRESGLTGFSLREATLGSLLDAGWLEAKSPFTLAARAPFLRDLPRRLSWKIPGEWFAWNEAERSLSFTVAVERLKDTGVGFFPQQGEVAAGLGLQIVPRLANQAFTSTAALGDYLSHIKELFPHGLIIFEGSEVLGYEHLLEEVAERMQRHGLSFGQVEFARQKGEHRLARLLFPNLVWVHSIRPEEMEELGSHQVAERYVRAVRERRVGVVYLRAYPAGRSDREFEETQQVIRTIVERVGLPSDDAPPLARVSPAVPLPALGLGWLGLSAVTLFFFAAIVRSPPAKAAAAAASVLLLQGVLFFLPQGKVVLALFWAIWVPVLAVAPLGRSEPVTLPESLFLYLSACLLTLLGAAAMSHHLAEDPFLSRLSLFRGVKIAYLFPLLVLAALFFAPSGARELPSLVAGLWQKPLTLGLCTAAAGLLAVMVLMLVRSGNEAASLASSWELAFRDLLERWLPVRPRTKEVFLGHPLLLLGLFLMRLSPPLGRLLLVVGAIGQVSIVNTFSHLHTPFLISVQRSLLGAGFGLLLGVALVLLVRRAVRWILAERRAT